MLFVCSTEKTAECRAKGEAGARCRHCPLGTLQVVEEECPEPKDSEVRVRVLAAGVSLPDIIARGRSSRNTLRALHAGMGPG